MDSFHYSLHQTFCNTGFFFVLDCFLSLIFGDDGLIKTTRFIIRSCQVLQAAQTYYYISLGLIKSK